MANEIVYSLRTEDFSTPTVNRVIQSYQQLDNQFRQSQRAIGNIIPSAQSWERQMSRLTTVNGLMFEGMRRINSMFGGMAFGVVVGGFSALTQAVINYAGKLSGLVFDQERFAQSLQATLDRSAQYERFVQGVLSAAPGKERGVIESRAQSVADELIKINNEVTAKLEAMRRQTESPLGVLQFPVERGQAEIEALNQRAAALRTELDVLRRLIGGRAVDIQSDELTAGGLNQEAIGRRIQQQAKLEFEARGFAQEQLGTFIRDSAAKQFQVEGEIQEQRGRIIKEQAAKELAIREQAEEAKGRAIQQGAAYELRVLEQTAAQEIQIEQMKANMLGHLSGAILAIANDRNRVAIRISQALALAQIAIQTRSAYMAALAPPPLGLGPVAGQTLANWVLVQGAVSAAAVLAATSRGASGGGSGGGAPRSISTGETNQGSTGSQRVTIDINLSNVVFADERSAIMLAHTIMPAIAKNLEENDFNIGNVQLLGARR